MLILLIAAMAGAGVPGIAEFLFCRSTSGDSVSASATAALARARSLMSPPTEKAFSPFALKITIWTLRSSFASRQQPTIAFTMSRVTAFNDSGRFNVIQAILSLTSYKTFSSAILCALQGMARHAPTSSDFACCLLSLPHRRALLGERARPLLAIFRRRDHSGKIGFQTQSFVHRQLHSLLDRFLDERHRHRRAFENPIG